MFPDAVRNRFRERRKGGQEPARRNLKMFELLFGLGILGAIILLPLLLVAGLLRLIFHIVMIPLHLAGALIGIVVGGVALAVVSLVIAVVVGTLTLAGAVTFLGPLAVLALVVGGAIWLVARLAGRRPSSGRTA